MSSFPAYTCPLCEYVLDAFDTECPRCHGKGLPSKTTTDVGINPPSPVPAPGQTHTVEAGVGVNTASGYPTLGGYNRSEESRIDLGPSSQGRSWGGLGAVAVVVALATAGFGGYRYWISTPQYSLLQVKSAFNAHDLPRFEQYLAIDECADALADDIFKRATAEMEKPPPLADGETPDPNRDAFRRGFVRAMLSGFKTTIAKALKENTRKIVLEGVESQEGSQSKANELWENFKERLDENEFNYQGLGGVEVNGETCNVKLNFYSDKTNQLYPIKLLMRRNEGHWQVTKWENATTFFERIGASFH